MLPFGCASCASAPPPAPQALIDEPSQTITNVEVAELDIVEAGADRFTTCAPPGELGQDWIPPIPAWSGGEGANARGRAEHVIRTTRAAFRKCYHRGLFYDPTQDGRVAVVLRVQKDGRVARAETYGACDLSSEVVACMREAAADLRFEAGGGPDTLVVPVVISGARNRRTQPRANDAYTAQAFVAIEGSRPALHACAVGARKEGKPVFASAIFGLDVDARGKVVHAHVDNWIGDQDVLTCAARALSAVTFTKPPAGLAHVMARVAINPRLNTK